jgi:hypothetical protein
MMTATFSLYACSFFLALEFSYNYYTMGTFHFYSRYGSLRFPAAKELLQHGKGIIASHF